MKTLNKHCSKVILLIIIGFCCSCKKESTDLKLAQPVSETTKEAVSPPIATIFPATEHTFTDIQVCYDNTLFLLEGGKLKKLKNNQLVDVPLPASIYTNFNPRYLAISKDFTFYLRASNGIKVIKNGSLIKYYKTGVAPLQDFNEASFGNAELSVDESDKSIVFAIPLNISDPNTVFVYLAKITKDGHYGVVSPSNVNDQSITAFGIGGDPGILWSNNLQVFVSNYYSFLVKTTLTVPPFTYNGESYGLNPGNHISNPIEGPIDKVEYDTMAGIEVSKDGKTVYIKTGGFGEDENPGGNGIADTGNILKVSGGQVKLIAGNVKNKRLAVSNDGKTLYIAGNGLFKINL